jgi:hypothetical protein
VEIAYSLKELWRRRIWVGLVIVLAVAGALATTYDVSLSPPGLTKPKTIESASASAELLIDSPRSAVGNLRTPLAPLSERTSIVALLLESVPVRAAIAESAGISPRELAINSDVGGTADPGQTRRSSQLVAESSPYRVQARGAAEGVPILIVDTVAPTLEEALALANGSAEAIETYIGEIQSKESTPGHARVQIRRVGEARGGVVNPGASSRATFLAFFGILVIGLVMVLFISRLVREMRARRAAAILSEPDLGIAPPVDNHDPRDERDPLEREFVAPGRGGHRE